MTSEIPLESATTPSASHGRLRGAAALRLHVTLFVSLAFCALAFFFELHRAESGNELSWAYVFDWNLHVVERLARRPHSEEETSTRKTNC